MNANELLFSLKSRVAPAERSALKDNTLPHISRYNRETLLRMLDMEEACPKPVDAARAKALHAALGDYLNRYMPEAPEAHRWIILACLFLALVAGEPMHPRDIVGWEQVEGGYICPAREEAGICQWCVCR